MSLHCQGFSTEAFFSMGNSSRQKFVLFCSFLVMSQAVLDCIINFKRMEN